MANRRDFLKTLAGGSAAAATTACTRVDPGTLIPHLVPPDDTVPGEADWYASVCRECPAGCGVLARVREGRPVKLEGNPDHPVNRGRLCARGQAGLQATYHPDRIRHPLVRVEGELRQLPWEAALARLASRLPAARIAWLGHHVTGSLDALIDEWLVGHPGALRLTYEPLSYEAVATANELLFGRRVVPSYDLARSRAIVSFGADFLETWLSNVSLTRQYAEAHRYREGSKGFHVHVGPRKGLTGENADLWLAAAPGSEPAVAAALLRRLVVDDGLGDGLGADERARVAGLLSGLDPEEVADRAGIRSDALERVARLLAERSPSVVLGGGATGASEGATALEAACALLNHATGAVGRTVRYDRPASIGEAADGRRIQELADRMRNGEVDVLFLHHVNPIHSMPAGAGFADAVDAVDTVVSFGSFLDETTARADLVLPDSTPMESWGDHRPVAGVHALQQPTIRPLFDTRSTGDVLLDLARRRVGSSGPSADDFHAYVRSRWRRLHRRAGDGGFDDFWEESLRRGGWFPAAAQDGGPATGGGGTSADDAAAVGGTASGEGLTGGDAGAAGERATSELVDELPGLDFSPAAPEGADGDLPLIVFPTVRWFDGRGANRPWLQELPDPVTKSTWTSWVEIHPETAAELGVGDGDGLRVRSPEGEIEAGAVVTDTVRAGAVAVPLGQGHEQYGRYAAGRGVDPMRLLPARYEDRSGALVRAGTRVTVEPAGRRISLYRTQVEETDHDRGIAREISLEELRGEPASRASKTTEGASEDAGGDPVRPDLYPDHDHPDHRWGMTIDTDACVGCGACEVACTAENNIHLAGPTEVDEGREMSWIRIERYRTEGGTAFVPMLCQHCDHAPCESVCPVYATYHTDEGLNAMVYNRCVGTRYCSNNCPYKVRRFNWRDGAWPDPLHLQLNPDVTPRSKGVMEKCTFCVQRIRAAELRADADDRELADGDVVPACAQTCPADAIVFGDLKDEDSRVRRDADRDPERAYHVLEELGTYPAITYLKGVRHGDREGTG